LQKRVAARSSVRVVWSQRHQHPDAPHPFGLLRARRDRPRRRASDERDELAPPQGDHATTSQWTDHGILSLSLQ